MSRTSFPDGVVFVPLAAISDPALVLPTIAQALGIPEIGDRPLLAQVSAALCARGACSCCSTTSSRSSTAAPIVADLLTACPRLKALVTSRAVLHLSGEHDFPVPPLPLPGDAGCLPSLAADLAGNEAIALFVARAQAAEPGLRPDGIERPGRRSNLRGASTACRWRWSWRQPGRGCWHRRRSWRGWAVG